MIPPSKPKYYARVILFSFLIILLVGSLVLNVAFSYLFYRGAIEHKSTLDLARGIAKYIHIAPPFGRFQPSLKFQPKRSCRFGENKTILVLGQSNAGNSAYTFTKAKDPNAAAFYDGQCFALVDPVPGGDGTRGSQWPAFADAFRQRFGQSVTIISAVWGATSIKDWKDNGFENYALNQIRKVKASGGTIDAVFWQQGEADIDLDGKTYAADLRIILERIRALGVNAPILIAQTTLENHRVNESIRAAQRAMAEEPGMAAGPDGDKITDRYDDVHLGADGTRAMADAWIEAVANCKCL